VHPVDFTDKNVFMLIIKKGQVFYSNSNTSFKDEWENIFLLGSITKRKGCIVQTFSISSDYNTLVSIVTDVEF